MSSNFPYIPVGVTLPNAPRDNSELLAWANQFGRAVQHMGRVLATQINSPLVIGPTAPGDYVLATGFYSIFAGTLQLTGTQSLVAKGTAMVRGI